MSRSQQWAELLEGSAQKNEARDCTVKALAAATGLSYSDCHAAMAKHGRKPKRGSHCYTMEKAAKSLGFQMIRQDRSSYSAKTCRTAPRDRRLAAMGSVILATSGHVAALVDGEVIDWTTGRLHRIQTVYQIKPIPGHVPAVIDRSTLPAGSDRWQSFTKYNKRDNLDMFA